MTAPQLTAYKQGQTVIHGDRANTFQQTCDNFAQLRAFVGLTGIQVFARGQTSPNDGGQGNFFWVSSAIGPDDNFNTIVPPGSQQGAWIRIPVAGINTSIYDLHLFIEGAPSNGEVFDIFNIVRFCSLPIGLAISRFSIATLPTATTTFTFKKNSSVIGTVAFSTGGVPTVTFTSAVNFAPGDQFISSAQAVADATAANISMTIPFTVAT